MNDYRKIWTGNASANLADGVTFVSLPLLAATLTDDPVAIAGLSVAYTLPRLLSVLGIGVLVDRVDRRKLLFWAGFSRGVLFAVLTVLVVSEATTLAALYVVYAVMGVVETLADSTAVAILPQAVPASGLDRANSQIAGTQVVVDEFVGPPLGGFLFGVAAFAPSLLNACAFLVAALAFVRLRGTYALPEAGERPGFVRQVREGAAWAWSNVVVRTLIAIGGLASVGYMIPFSYLVLYAEDVLGLDAAGYGLLLSASAVGGLLGSVVAGPVRRRVGYGWTVVGALLVGAGSFAVIAVSGNVWVVGFFLAAYIGHAVVWNVMAASIRQKATPAALMGRVGSVGRLVGIGGLSAGAGLGGVLAQQWGYQAPFAVAAGFFVLCALLMAATFGHFRAFEHADEPQVREEA
ncbi:MFS transporter [Streptomyces sp. NPDC049881]|uniref:MFS transporter n=1 Tax=Streptomyces sp. NPDC049881 TaxID=3155778 RepID=UPI003413ED46